jgi:hypothetical protein
MAVERRRMIRAAQTWRTNAELVADCARLGYIKGHVLDPTWGQGKWWTIVHRPIFEPKLLSITAHDKFTLDGVDFRALPEADDTFDSVAFDPPYVSPGGRETTTIQEMFDAYGMGATPKTPWELFCYNDAGFAECVRVVKPGGTICYKSKDYITSGKLQPVTHWIIEAANRVVHADRVGRFAPRADLEYVDRLEHIGNPGPQSQRTQVHARRNLSTMLVFRKR